MANGTKVKPLIRNLALLLAAAAACAQTGSIQGNITDDTGLAVPNAYVVATSLGSGPHITRTALTSAAGAYTLDQAAPGPYMLCVQAPHTPYLDPCVWSSPAKATVTAGQITAATNIRVVKGAMLQVRVDDSQGQYLAKGLGTVLFGVTAPSGRFHPLSVAAKDPSGETHDTAIPWSTALKLELLSNKLQVSDSKGSALGLVPAAVPIQQPIGQGDLNLTFHITGTH